MLDIYEPDKVITCTVCGGDTTEYVGMTFKHKDGDKLTDVFHIDYRYSKYFVKVDGEYVVCCGKCWRNHPDPPKGSECYE